MILIDFSRQEKHAVHAGNLAKQVSAKFADIDKLHSELPLKELFRAGEL